MHMSLYKGDFPNVLARESVELSDGAYSGRRARIVHVLYFAIHEPDGVPAHFQPSFRAFRIAIAS